MYFASTNLDAHHIASACNDAWLQPGHDPDETLRIINNYRGKLDYEHVGTAKFILQQHATGFYLVDDIFPRKKYRFYNEYKNFLYKINKRSEVDNFLRDTVGYIFSTKTYCWEYYCITRDKHGRTLKNTTINLSKHPPFDKSDDLEVQLYPPRELMIKTLKQRVQKKTKDKETCELYTKIHSVLTTAKNVDISILYGSCQLLLKDEAPRPCDVRISKLLKHLQVKHKLKRYSGVTFRPYAGKETWSREGVLNTFTGFHFEHYTPKRAVDVRKTAIWTFLRDVYGFGKEGALLDHVLNIFAWVCQFPWCRSERITAILSPKEGTGKSTIYSMWEAILSKKYCIFHESLKPYLQQFNIINHSKLIIWCDDISASSQMESRKLFSKCTSRTQAYESKGEKQFILDEFSSLWITANNESPLHTSPNDRRQQILEADDSHIQDRIFFRKVHDEFADFDIAYAWYQFFKARDLGKWTPACNPPTKAKGKTVVACMKKSHIFMNRFFCGREWLTAYVPSGSGSSSHTKKIEARIKTRGYAKQLMLRLEQKLFYHQYARFMKENFGASKARNMDTFLKEVEDLGVIVQQKRLSVNARKYHVVDIYYSRLAGVWKKMYPDLEFNTWDSETDRKIFLDTLKTHQDGEQYGF